MTVAQASDVRRPVQIPKAPQWLQCSQMIAAGTRDGDLGTRLFMALELDIIVSSLFMTMLIQVLLSLPTQHATRFGWSSLLSIVRTTIL